MWNKMMMGLLAIAALGIVSTPCSNAGTEIVRDYGGSAPAYNYAPPPPPVYYAPPPVRVAIYPTFGYYARPYGVYGSHRVFVRRHHWYPHH